MAGRVKWFSKEKGFGFLVVEQLRGDVMIHRTALNEHGRNSLPDGAILTVECTKRRQGWIADRVLTIDLSELPPPPVVPGEYLAMAGKPEPVEVKWFNYVRGFGFVVRQDGSEAFLHAEVMRSAGFRELNPGQQLDARIAPGPKGDMVVTFAERQFSSVAA